MAAALIIEILGQLAKLVRDGAEGGGAVAPDFGDDLVVEELDCALHLLFEPVPGFAEAIFYGPFGLVHSVFLFCMSLYLWDAGSQRAIGGACSIGNLGSLRRNGAEVQPTPVIWRLFNKPPRPVFCQVATLSSRE